MMTSTLTSTFIKIHWIFTSSDIINRFSNYKQLNFGHKIGCALTFVMITAKESNADPNMLNQGIREAMEDIHDDLRLRYLKLSDQ